MSVRLLSIVPGKPMYTSTKEFRPQSQKSCYQKTFWGWHTQYTQSRSPFSGPKDPQIACYLAVTPLSDAMVFYAMGIFRFIFNICRNHIVFSVPFNLAEVTSVSQFSLIMETKIQFDWITFTQLINIWYKKNLQGNWTICIIQVPVTPIYDVKISYMRGQIKPKVRSKSNYPNLSFWYEIRHLGGQIKHRSSRSM